MMKTNKTIQKIIKTIKNNSLISPKDRVLVALSGGADSVFLLHVLKQLSESEGFEIGACHVEHGIRGEASVADMEFSKELCKSLGIDCFAQSFDVPSVSKKEKLSLEAAGRKVRYDYFQKLMAENGYTLLATAHHKDDKIETVLMNILRGCGLRGFAGIEYKNGNVIRPLLDISKSQILEFCKDNGILYCTDDTNFDTEYTRNKIRHVLLPKLKEFNPSFDESLMRQSKIFTDEDDFLNNVAEKALCSCVCDNGLDVAGLNNLHPAIMRRVIYMYLSECKGSAADITYLDVEALMSLCTRAHTGKLCHLSGGIKVEVSYGKLFISEENEAVDFEYKLEFFKPVIIDEAGIKVTLLPTGGNLLINDGDEVIIRSRKDGDYFYPVGMTGKKKLKQYFQDKKILRSHRDTVPVLEINGEIASVVGMRNDRRFFDCGGSCCLKTETI